MTVYRVTADVRVDFYFEANDDGDLEARAPAAIIKALDDLAHAQRPNVDLVDVEEAVDELHPAPEL